jgi:hypothetical protein
MGGQAHVPSILRTSILNFMSMEKESYGADFLKKSPPAVSRSGLKRGFLYFIDFHAFRINSIGS